MPPELKVIIGELPPELLAVAKILGAIAIALAVHALVFRVLGAVGRHSPWRLDKVILKALRRPARWILALLAVLWVLPAVTELEDGQLELLHHLVGIGVIAGVTWLAAALVDAWGGIILERHDPKRTDDVDSRRVLTQVVVLERTVIVLIVILGTAAILMTFPRIREIGASLLVSAGFAGLAIGLAARPVLENLIGGLQLAFTQPIRIDDVVIVEGEWGRIEEITATYVVVRIWDDRRLVVPFSHFIARPFQNWTRNSSAILCTVFLYTDYTVPVQKVREELTRLCPKCEYWDGRLSILQVTNATEHTVELRALVSASDAARAWELRVWLREHLLEYLQREHPASLPRTRVAFEGETPATVAAEP